jgi:hypothetical protein
VASVFLDSPSDTKNTYDVTVQDIVGIMSATGDASVALVKCEISASDFR